MVQDDANDQTARTRPGGNTWVTLKEAAALLKVSVNTVKRRMQRGELEGRQEPTSRGFRWLVRLDPVTTDPTESPRQDDTVHAEEQLKAQPNSAEDVDVAHDVRTGEIISHETYQARSGLPKGILARLRRRFRGRD